MCCATRWNRSPPAPTTRCARKRPEERGVYCGANPISDLWTEHAVAILAKSLRTVVGNGADLAARTQMMLAATYAGMGFGNAGVHLPHAAAYPIAGRVRGYHAAGYPGEEPLVPHGQAVSLTAPAAFRFTFSAAPERHTRVAAVLDPRVADLNPPERLPAALVNLMRDIGIPSGLAEIGFAESDIDDLVQGTLAQQRLLAQSPITPTAADLATIFAGSMSNW